ncbi:Hypothetical predicted protein [Mytilus galloprovincialis]|uniref:Uncharacterized protein n=2 Tax=Mytilus galloprovincialis TaxID=29158 RepID=A0A8B6DAM3_MYTGA|nr:Hypothetical predicted protein [Mytilus galloprovincialis]
MMQLERKEKFFKLNLKLIHLEITTFQITGRKELPPTRRMLQKKPQILLLICCLIFVDVGAWFRGRAYHITHIANGTRDTIKIELVKGTNTYTRDIAPNTYVRIKTGIGRQTLCVFAVDDTTRDNEVCRGERTDRSFVIRTRLGQPKIYRALYGKIWKIDKKNP